MAGLWAGHFPAKKMIKKILSSILLIVIVAVVSLVVFRNQVIQFVMARAVTQVTGFPTTVGGVNYNFPADIEIKGLHIENPSGFSEKVFADIPEIYLNFSLEEFLKKERIHIREMRLNIQQINIERNAEGVTNLQKLSSVGQTSAPSGKKVEKAPAPKEPAMPFLLDKFVLTMRKVGFKNNGPLLPGVPPAGGAAVDMNVNGQVFTNIQDPLVLVNLIVMKILYGTTFGNLLGLNPKELLGKGLDNAFANGGQLLNSASGMVTKELGGLTAKAGGVLPGEVNQATEKLAGSVSGIFGKLKSTAESTAKKAGVYNSQEQTAKS